MTCTGSLCDGGVIGGGLTVLAGVIAYRGARNAADRQIKDAQTARNESDRRRLNVVEWAVRAEGSRLRAEIDARHRALPSKAQFAARRVEQLVIESSPLLRGQREDMALLDIEPRRCLEEISSALDEYNAQIRTAPRGNADQPNISQTALDLIVHLGELAAALRAGWDHRSRIRRASRPVCVEVDSTALNCGHVCLVADNPLVPPPPPCGGTVMVLGEPPPGASSVHHRLLARERSTRRRHDRHDYRRQFYGRKCGPLRCESCHVIHRRQRHADPRGFAALMMR